MNVSVIIPALNEEAAIGPVIDDLMRVRRDEPAASSIESWEIVVADNGSSDRTAEVALAHGARVVREPRRGYGAACQAGIAAADPRSDVMAFMDGDRSDVAEDLPALLAPLVQERADLAVGRRIPQEGGALTPPQRFGNALACRLMHWLFGHRYHDLGPFRVIRRAALESLEMRDAAFGWTVEMQIKAVRRNLRIVEVPVRYRARIGRSKISGTVLGSLKAGIAILWTIVRYYFW